MIREVIGELLLRDLRDPRLEMVTLTEVKVAADLKSATVYFSARGVVQKEEEALEGFQSAGGYIKKALAKELRLRYTPELFFKVDHSFEYGSKIDRLIKTIHREEEGDSGENR